MRNEVKKIMSAISALTLLSVYCVNTVTADACTNADNTLTDISGIESNKETCPDFCDVISVAGKNITDADLVRNVLINKTAICDDNPINQTSNWNRVVKEGLWYKNFEPIYNGNTCAVKALKFYCIGEQYPSYLIKGESSWYVFDSYGITIFKFSDLDSIIKPEDYNFSSFNTRDFINYISIEGVKSDVNCMVYTGKVTSEILNAYYTYTKAMGDSCNSRGLYACGRDGLLEVVADNKRLDLDYCEFISEDIVGQFEINSKSVLIIGNLINYNENAGKSIKDCRSKFTFNDVVNAEHSEVELAYTEVQEFDSVLRLNSKTEPVKLKKYSSLGHTTYVFDALETDVELVLDLDNFKSTSHDVADGYVFVEAGINSDSEFELSSNSNFRIMLSDINKSENNAVYITNDDFIGNLTPRTRTYIPDDATYHNLFIGLSVTDLASRRSGLKLPEVAGDANTDGIIDIRDVTAIARQIIKLDKLGGIKFDNADIIHDGNVDIKDLSQLKKYLIKDIDKEFLIQTPYLFSYSELN